MRSRLRKLPDLQVMPRRKMEKSNFPERIKRLWKTVNRVASLRESGPPAMRAVLMGNAQWDLGIAMDMNCQTWLIISFSEWECCDGHFVFGVVVSHCILGMCRCLIFLHTFCRDGHILLRDSGLGVWRHDWWTAVFLGERMSIFCLQEGEWVTFLVIRRADCGSPAFITYPGYLLAGHIEGCGVGLCEPWIIEGGARSSQGSSRMIQIEAAPSAQFQMRTKRCEPILDTHVHEQFVEIFGLSDNIVNSVDTFASFQNGEWCILCRKA